MDDLPGDFMAVSDPDTRPLVTAKLELEDEMQTKAANIQEALPMVALANSTPGSYTAMKVPYRCQNVGSSTSTSSAWFCLGSLLTRTCRINVEGAQVLPRAWTTSLGDVG